MISIVYPFFKIHYRGTIFLAFNINKKNIKRFSNLYRPETFTFTGLKKDAFHIIFDSITLTFQGFHFHAIP